MVILGTRNKIIDFLMILAWASPFKRILLVKQVVHCGMGHSHSWACILVQVKIYRRLLIGRKGYLDQSEAYDIS